MKDLLFVYGTLLSNAEGELGMDERRRLQSQGTLIGAAAMAGRLVRLGDYPGMIASFDAGLVHGEIYELADSDRTFSWLDAYEDFDLQHPESGEYARVRQAAHLNDGAALKCWVYVLRDRPENPVFITTGVWT